MNRDHPEKEVEKIVQFLKTTFTDTGFPLAVIGLSGGVDSAVALALTTQALGNNNVYPVLLPYGNLNTQGVLDAMAAIETLAIPLSHVLRIDVKPAVDAICGKEFSMEQVRKGNVIARVRMTYLFDQAKKRNALVIGTENKSEHTLGYFTRFGDAASDVEPISHLYKTEVYGLARFLTIPKEIIDKAPSAGLWVEQTDEKELGFSYEDADPILEQLVDQKKSVEEIIVVGFDKTLVERIANHVKRNSFKYKTPYTLL